MERLLKTIGKARFTENFNQFKDFSYEDVINHLIANETSNYDGARRRTIAAKELFRLNMERQALQNIINSPRLSNEIRELASRILNLL